MHFDLCCFPQWFAPLAVRCRTALLLLCFLIIDSRRHSLLIGLSKVDVLVLTLAWRTNPYLSGKTSVIRPIAHAFLGKDSSTTITVSPTAKFFFGRNHFWRDCNRGRYSLFQRPQKTSAKYCTCRHLLLEYVSLFKNKPGGRGVSLRSRRRWFGDSGSKSFGSSETVVRGLPLIMLSHSHNKVWRLSSSRLCSLTRAPRTLRVDLISLSQTPPWCEAPGGLKTHLMLFCRRASWILAWFQLSIMTRSSLSPPTKFEPLSERISLTWPLRAIKRLSARMKELVSNEWHTFRWTARNAKKIKIAQ